MKVVRIALVGAGAITEHTARDLRHHDAVQLVAIADPSEPRRAALADRFDIPYTYADAHEAWQRDDVDAVYVATPNALHAPMACAALEAGKHVLLEKPFALNAAEAAAVVDAARRHDRLLMLGMSHRFDAAVQRARLLVKGGELGPVYYARAYWRRRAGIPRIGSWFTHKATAGGGALLDVGVHVLDTVLYVLDRYDAVAVSGATFLRLGNRGQGDGAWGRSERSDTVCDVDDLAAALVRLADGTTVNLEAAWALHQPSREEFGAELFGEDAGLDVHRNRLFRHGNGGAFHSIEGLPDSALPYPHCNRNHHFVNVLLERETPAISADQALTVQRILDAVYASAAAGKDVAL